MAYTDYTFYKDQYFGTIIPEADFPRLVEKASDFMDTLTFDRLVDGLPTDERAATKVQKAVCAVAETLYQIGLAEQQALSAASGTSTQIGVMSGTTGVITSKSSGSESISYASPSELAGSAKEWSAVYAAAGDTAATNKILTGAALPYLSGVMDDKGVCLLYAGIG